MKNLTEKQISKISASTRASIEMEGLTLSKEAEEISKKFLRGEISDSEAKKQIIKISGVRGV